MIGREVRPPFGQGFEQSGFFRRESRRRGDFSRPDALQLLSGFVEDLPAPGRPDGPGNGPEKSDDTAAVRNRQAGFGSGGGGHSTSTGREEQDAAKDAQGEECDRGGKMGCFHRGFPPHRASPTSRVAVPNGPKSRLAEALMNVGLGAWAVIVAETEKSSQTPRRQPPAATPCDQEPSTKNGSMLIPRPTSIQDST